MFIELIDLLRCPVPHEESWLVAAVERFYGRFVAQGSLGCPVCRAQYAVRDGAVWFDTPERASCEGLEEANDAALLRVRAFLGLTEPGGVVLLAGRRGVLAPALEDTSEVAPLLLNPEGIAPAPGRSTLMVGDALPLAAGGLRGVVADAGYPDTLVAGMVRALRPGGRMLAPLALAVPVGIRELARDDQEWVGERIDPGSAPQPLRRAPTSR